MARPGGLPNGRAGSRSASRRSRRALINPKRRSPPTSSRSKVRGCSRPIQPHPRAPVSTGYRVAMSVEKRINRANELIRRVVDSGSDGRERLLRLTAFATATEQAQDHQLHRPSRVNDGRAEIRTDRPLRLEDIEGVRPGIERRVEEEDE